MSNLFAVCGVLPLTFAQCLVSSVLRGEENHIWLFTYPQFSRLRQSFDQLLMPELWTTLWQVNFEAREARIMRGELFRSPWDYHRTLAASERKMRNKLDEIEPLSRIFTTSKTASHPRFLYRESQRRQCRFVYLEDGLGAYKPLTAISRRKQQLPPARRGIKSRVSDVLTATFLRLTRRQALYSPEYKPMRYDEAWLMFPAKCPEDEFPGAMMHDLSRHVTPERINHLKQRANLSAGMAELQQADSRNAALFLSQSLTEDSFLNMEHEVALTQRILEQLSRRYERVFYKPHPRDSLEKTTAILSQQTPQVQRFPETSPLPVEIMLAGNPIQACYGICSSSLVYLPLFADTRTYSLFPWLMRELEYRGVDALSLKTHFEACQVQFEREVVWLEDIAHESI